MNSALSSDEAVPMLAQELNLSRAEVHGVVTFYHDFRDAPPGTHVVSICRAEACQSVGADALVDACRAAGSASTFGETTPTVRSTLDQVFCLGNCALGPAVEVDGSSTAGSMPTRFDSDRRETSMTRATITVYVPRDAAARSVGADEVARRSRIEARQARRRCQRSSATARAACSGSSRWSRSRRRRPRRLRPGDAGRRRRLCSTPDSSTAAAHPLCARADRRDPVSAEPAAPDVRARAASSIRSRSTTT